MTRRERLASDLRTMLQFAGVGVPDVDFMANVILCAFDNGRYAATPTPEASVPGAPCVAGAAPQPEAFSVPACGVCGYPVQHCDDWTDRSGVCKCSGGRERASAPATSRGGFEAGDYDGIQSAIDDAMATHAALERATTPARCPHCGCAIDGEGRCLNCRRTSEPPPSLTKEREP
jgi:hypothetical protein